MSHVSTEQPDAGWALFLLYSTPVLLLMIRRHPHPYGKFSLQGSEGRTLHSGLAWMMQESPVWMSSVVLIWRSEQLQLFLDHGWQGSSSSAWRSLLVSLLFTLHYLYRSLIYGRTIRAASSRSRLALVLGSMFFTLPHGLLQTYYTFLQPPRGGSGQLLLGLTLMLFGEAVNTYHDRKLVELKARLEDYGVPRGGWFSLVSSANYTGEMVAIAGYALLADNTAAWVFFLFTFVVLLHRGHYTHAFYKKKFHNYPKQRFAVLPFIW